MLFHHLQQKCPAEFEESQKANYKITKKSFDLFIIILFIQVKGLEKFNKLKKQPQDSIFMMSQACVLTENLCLCKLNVGIKAKFGLVY